MDKELRREIILDNYNNPFHKNTLDIENYIKINTNNENCIDNLDIYFLIEDGVIKDIKFDGEACAISISATSIINRLLINKKKEEVEEIVTNYENMILEKEYDKDILKDLIVHFTFYLTDFINNLHIFNYFFNCLNRKKSTCFSIRL